MEVGVSGLAFTASGVKVCVNLQVQLLGAKVLI